MKPAIIPWPTDLEPHFQPHCREACDMLVGPCICGAWHLPGEHKIYHLPFSGLPVSEAELKRGWGTES